jgi:Kdo2-lipid IVA lauroyltransferase/acyltransferase
MTEEKEKGKGFMRGFRLFYIGLLKGISRMPFPFLYVLAGFLAFVLYRIVGYRRQVILTNLRLSFPEKSRKEIRTIMRRFYYYFADTTLETIKGYSISRRALEKRVTYKGIGTMNAFAEKGRSILLFGMHYGNWEWSGLAQLWMKHQYQVIYNPMRNNPEFDIFLRKIRERWGVKTVPVDKSAKIALGYQTGSVPNCVVLAEDQRPPFITQFWTTFMNQEACFNSGVEKIARKTNQPIFLHHCRRLKRGHYEITFTLMVENPAEMSEQEILLTYVRTIEERIREAPEYYLWSHRRWKQKRPEGYVLY